MTGGAGAVLPERVALLGGTFDPVHLGHLAVLEQVCAAIGATRGWLVPTSLPPHRRPARASAEDRLAMARAAVAGHPRLSVLDLELRRPGASYTIDSLDELEAAHPAVELWWVLGADAARDVPTWYRSAELLARARFVLVNRSGAAQLTAEEVDRLGFAPERTILLRVESPPVSATEARRRAAAGESLAGLVPEAVARLIAERALYRAGEGVG